LEGRIAGPHVATLEQCWRELVGSTPKSRFSVDLCGVSYIDHAGKALLREMHRLGANFLAEGCLNQAIVSEISQEENQEKAEGHAVHFLHHSLWISGHCGRRASSTTCGACAVARTHGCGAFDARSGCGSGHQAEPNTADRTAYRSRSCPGHQYQPRGTIAAG